MISAPRRIRLSPERKRCVPTNASTSTTSRTSAAYTKSTPAIPAQRIENALVQEVAPGQNDRSAGRDDARHPTGAAEWRIDLAEQVLNRSKHPEWQGERTKLVYSFPTNDRLWAEYARLRADSLRNDGDGHEATEFYRERRELMDAGATIGMDRFGMEHVLSDAQRFRVLGVDHVALGDTTGMANPRSVAELFAQMKGVTPIAHFHDTRGTGLVNYVAAYEAGVRHFDSSFGGVGGHPAKVKYGGGYTGNVCTEDLVSLFESMGLDTGIDLDARVETAEMCEQALGRELYGRVVRSGLNPLI